MSTILKASEKAFIQFWESSLNIRLSIIFQGRKHIREKISFIQIYLHFNFENQFFKFEELILWENANLIHNP